jgi:outer membrane biosynthesis protein TonB
MRLLASLALLIFSWAAFAQSGAEKESNMYCVERLQMPVYPPIADAARISGTLKATVTLDSDGSLRQPIVTDMGTASASAKRFFPPAVDEALRRSSFHKDCGGKSVTLVFTFVLGEDLDPNHLRQTVSYGYPNRFWITVPAKIMQP